MKIVSKEEVYKAKYFKIEKLELERNGKTFTKEFIKRNPAVFILPITHDGKIHMIRQHRDSFDKELLEIVAGTMEVGGDPLETAKRELQEETGLTAKTWKHMITWELSVNMNATIYVYVATDLEEGIARPDEDEEITQVKMPVDEAIEKATSGEIVAASHAAALLLYKQLVLAGKL